MKINITGDFVVTRENAIDPGLIRVFENSDLNIVNLEAPVTSSINKIIKTGPHIKADEQMTKKAFKELKIDLVTLANNHVFDYGKQGIEDTLEFCRQNKIATVGANVSLESASKSYYIETVEGRIGIVNFAENEWASAKENEAGANPMDLIDNAKQIKKTKLEADYVFVIVHGGHEYYNLPSPRMQKQYRFYADCGADLVVGHHTHCISGYEVYNKAPIYYSLGNFLFTSDSKHTDWYTGLVLEIIIKNKSLSTKVHPVQQEKKSFKIGLLEDQKKNDVINMVSFYSEIIRDSNKLITQWESYVDTKYVNYMQRWAPVSFVQNRYLKSILSRLGFTGLNVKGVASNLNLMRCEAHADLSKSVNQKYLSDHYK